RWGGDRRAGAEHGEQLDVAVLDAAARTARPRLVLAALRSIVAEESLAAAIAAIRHRVVTGGAAVDVFVLVVEAERVAGLLRRDAADRQRLTGTEAVRERERDDVRERAAVAGDRRDAEQAVLVDLAVDARDDALVVGLAAGRRDVGDVDVVRRVDLAHALHERVPVVVAPLELGERELGARR